MWLMVSLGVMFLVLGVMIKHFKWHWLIAGYNTMSKEQKKKVDIEGLSKLMGNYCFAMSGALIILGLLNHWGFNWAVWVFVALILIGTLWLLVSAQKFDGNAVNEDGTLKEKTKLILGGLFAFFLAIGVFIFISSLAPEINVSQKQVEVSGTYGVVIPTEDITALSLEESLPKVQRKINGINAGNTLKGHFQLQDIGRARLAIQQNKPPFIVIKTKSKEIIIVNAPDAEKTREFFQRINSAWIN